jgi:two-component system chemotaxis response regulator CheB
MEAGLEEVEGIVIGASAGAVSALSHLLPSLPAQYPLPVIVVVHVPQAGGNLAELFRAKCRVTVKEAEDKEPIVAGTVYFAPAGYHVLVEKSLSLSLSSEEPVRFSRPSIDVLFESAADAYGSALLAIVLTGANEDGAQGVRAVCEAGGAVIVQAPESAEARVMPDGALAACPNAQRMTLAAIAEFLCVTR